MNDESGRLGENGAVKMVRKREIPGPYRVITMDVDGVTYTGHFRVDSKLITVRFQGRETTTQLGGSAADPGSLAGVLLSELLRAAGKR